MASVCRESQRSPRKDTDPFTYTSHQKGSVISRPVIFKTFSLYEFCIMFIFSTTYLLSTMSATSNFNISATSFNFSVEGTSYNCSSNVICRGLAHIYTHYIGHETYGIQNGMLSLVPEIFNDPNAIVNSAGLAYYDKPVRLLDIDTQQSASFATSFKMDLRTGFNSPGDGMAFVLSEDNSTVGYLGKSFGIFNEQGATSFKTIVVEFDIYSNPGYPFLDISNNHVSLDFSNVTVAAVADASDVAVLLWDNVTKYAWVDYSYETQQLEVRVSYTDSRPIYPLVNKTVSLFDVAAEYMWVGFSGGNAGKAGDWVSNYYVGDWYFESHGITTNPAQNLTQPEKKNHHTGLIVGISVAGGALVLATIFVVLRVRRRSGYHRRRRFQHEDLVQVDGMPERFTYEDLRVATRNFSEDSKLGQGGFGSVYHGMLPSSGVEVAVKKISSNSSQGEKEFLAEISIINQSRHRNLIQLRGWCKDASKRQYLLVYELMSNGSLDKWLFEKAEGKSVCLSWPRRFNIVKGIALAVEYLHQGCVRQVIHRDIKSSNIMLDENFNVKLGDFGLSRLVDHPDLDQDAAPRTKNLGGTSGNIVLVAFDGKSTSKTTMLAGTRGYIAPEAFVFNKCTDKTDVYAFGVVVLEVACGRKAYLQRLWPSEETVLVDWVWHRMSEGQLLTVVDRRLGEYDPTWMEVMLKVGLLCAHNDPQSRPSMETVVRMLAGDFPVPPIPPRTSDEQSLTINHLLNPDSCGTSRYIPGSTKLTSMELSGR